MSDDRDHDAPDRRRRGPSDPDTASDGKGDSRLLRGLAIGALVGVAIAGSTIWQRRQVRRRIRRELIDEAVSLDA